MANWKDAAKISVRLESLKLMLIALLIILCMLVIGMVMYAFGRMAAGMLACVILLACIGYVIWKIRKAREELRECDESSGQRE